MNCMKSVDEEFPLKEGYTRVYEDHTGRWFKDYSPEEYEEAFNSPEMQEFGKILQEEIDKEVINKMLEIYNETNPV